MTQSTEEALRFVQETIRAALEETLVPCEADLRRAIAKRAESFIDDLKSMPAYSEARVYAADIRALGATLDERIPNCAWVPASAVHFGCGAQAAGDGAELNVTIKFDRPFKWIELPITITPARPE
jgi:hypothetical protein